MNNSAHATSPSTLNPLSPSFFLDTMLQQSYSDLCLLAENAPLKLAIVCPNTDQILWANQAYCDFLGYDAEEIRSLTFPALTHPDDPEANLSQTDGLTDGQYFQAEQRFQKKDGTWTWTKVTLARLRSEDERSHYTVAVVEDFSEHQQTVEALQRSEARNRSIVEALPDTIFRFDGNGLYLDFVAGYQAPLDPIPLSKDFIGKSIHDVLPTPAAKQIQKAICQALLTQQIQSCEYDLKFGEVHRYYEARIVVCSPSEVIAIVRDISEYKQIEAALESSQSQILDHNQEIQSLARQLHQSQTQLKQAENLVTLGTVAAGTAQEFRRYIAQIRSEVNKSYQDLHALLTLVCLYEQFYPTPPPSIESEIELVDPDICIEELPRASRSIRTKLQQADQFAEFLEKIAQSPQLVPTIIDIHPCLDNVIKAIQPALKASKIRIQTEYKGTPYIRAYPGQLYYALLNLFQDAINQIEPHPKKHTILTVKTVSPTEDQLQIVLKATSNQRPTSQTAQGANSERQLAFSHQIIETLHKGKIIYHTPSHSSQLTVKLPAREC